MLWAGLFSVFKLVSTAGDHAGLVLNAAASAAILGVSLFMQVSVVAFLLMDSVGVQAFRKAALISFALFLMYTAVLFSFFFVYEVNDDYRSDARSCLCH